MSTSTYAALILRTMGRTVAVQTGEDAQNYLPRPVSLVIYRVMPVA